jgi:hypothetical protein
MRAECILALVVMATTLISGCTTATGPENVISSKGILIKDTPGLPSALFAATNASYLDRPNPAKAHEMMRTGYAVIYANCSDFFSSAGQTQKWLVFSRDSIGAAGTLTTAVMALHNASHNAVANVALATGAAFSGIDIYTKNFLFSAENVDSVRQLTLRALDAHAAAVGFHDDDDYEFAYLTLLDNQDYCSSMSITAMAREAIKKGDVVASNNPSDDLKSITDVQDEAVLSGLGRALHPPGALTMDQAGALWWLLKSTYTTDQLGTIATKLKDLDADKSPIKNGKYVDGWPLLDKVDGLLDKFSNDTKEAIKKTIADASAPPKPGEASKLIAANILFNRATLTQRRHVTLEVK